MSVEVYIDELFLVNFFVNIVTTIITRMILSRNISFKRELSINLIFTLISVLVVVTGLRRHINIFSLFLVSASMTYFLFKPKDLYSFFKYFAVLKFSSVCINGFVLFLRNHYENTFNIYILFLSLVCAYVSTIVLRKIAIENSTCLDINIINDNKEVVVKGFVDTGNLLIEPISKKPVIIVEFSAIRQLLPMGLADIYENKAESNLMEIIEAITDDNFRKNLRIIPFKSVGNENGMLIGFIAERVVINEHIINKPVVAIYKCNLSKSGIYNALLSPKHLGGI